MDKETPINTLNISVRLSNICKQNGIDTIGKLLGINDVNLLGLRGLGRGTLAEIQAIRDAYGNRRERPIGEILDVVKSEKENAINSQWTDAKDIIPSIEGDFSDYVLTYGTGYNVARYNRYSGWMTKENENIFVSYWMRIPKPPSH